MKSALIFIAALSAAFLAGFFFPRTGHEPSASVACEACPADRAKNLRAEMQKLVDEELADYARLRSLEEKYQKADELLARMIQIFISDLGLRVSPEVQAGLGSKPTPGPAPVAAAAPTSPILNSQASGSAPTTVATAQLPIPRDLGQIRNQRDIDEFLEAARPAEPDRFVLSAAPLMDPSRLAEISGRFMGRSQVEKKNQMVTWEISMTFQGNVRSGKLQGRHRIVLAENGRVFSNKDNRGTLDDDILTSPMDPDAVIIRASPNIFLQTYYLKDQDAMMGLILERSGTGKPYKVLGSFQLQRQR